MADIPESINRAADHAIGGPILDLLRTYWASARPDLLRGLWATLIPTQTDNGRRGAAGQKIPLTLFLLRIKRKGLTCVLALINSL
jgi:hypothetical protein